jgi:hypothetical protein
VEGERGYGVAGEGLQISDGSPLWTSRNRQP